MTKQEYEKLEKVLGEAIQVANESNNEYKKAEDTKETIEKYILERKSWEHRGYAEGIHQVLASIGFTHEDMETLEKILDV